MKRLIVNSDDFGLTAGVNRAVLELHRNNTLTSATLMAAAGAMQEACSIALGFPSLGVGCHIVLIDGKPVLPSSELPTLVNAHTGRFRSSLSSFVRDLILGRIRESEIQAEAEAQIALLQSSGLKLTHLDSHKHTHLFPQVLRPLANAAKIMRMTAVRNPFEPSWSLNATTGAPRMRRAQVRLLDIFRPSFLRQIARSGLTTTDGAVGILATGTMNAATLARLLENMPEGLWELVTHPGYSDLALAESGTRLLASREVEFEALKTLAVPKGIELTNFGILAHGYRLVNPSSSSTI